MKTVKGETSGTHSHHLHHIVCAMSCFLALSVSLGPILSVNAEPPRIIVREAPVRFAPHVMRGVAKIPADVPFGVVCDLDGVILTGDWKAIGRVTSVDDETGIILFNTEAFYKTIKPPKGQAGDDDLKGGIKADEVTDQSRAGRLAYRLPGGRTLPMQAGDPITILHDHNVHAKRMEWEIHISSGEELILATAHLHDDTPPQSPDKAEVLFDNLPIEHSLFYWSDPSDDDKDQILRGVRENWNVNLQPGDGQFRSAVASESDGRTLVTLGKNTYEFVVVSSELYSSPEENDGESISLVGIQLSHSLECILVKLAEQDRQ